jgi:hypothetical protein
MAKLPALVDVRTRNAANDVSAQPRGASSKLLTFAKLDPHRDIGLTLV